MNEIEFDEIDEVINIFKEKEPEIYNLYKDTEMLSDVDIYEIVMSESLSRIFRSSNEL